MRKIEYSMIVKKVAEMCQKANFDLGHDVLSAFEKAKQTEASDMGKSILDQLLLNAEIASKERIPMCQDTGVAVFIVQIGQECAISGGTLTDAINEGVRKGYGEGYLRSSIVQDPIKRHNTGDNSPAVIHLELVPGDQLKIKMTAKGGGAENMSALNMLKPSDGIDGVKNFILETVKTAGPNACPPLVVGVGIGGNFERCAFLAKKSLFCEIGKRHEREDIAMLEEEMIEQINKLGIGPQGMGGNTTAIDVKIEVEPCHIAALPVAVNLNCHASRHQETVI